MPNAGTNVVIARRNQTTMEPLLISVDEFCDLAGIPRSQYSRNYRLGRIGMRPIYIDSRPRFNYAEAVAWVNAGCPNDGQWQAMIQQIPKLKRFDRRRHWQPKTSSNDDFEF